MSKPDFSYERSTYPAGTPVLAIKGPSLGKQYTVMDDWSCVFRAGEAVPGPNGKPSLMVRSKNFSIDGLVCQILKRLKDADETTAQFFVYPVSWLVPIEDPDSEEKRHEMLREDLTVKALRQLDQAFGRAK